MAVDDSTAVAAVYAEALLDLAQEKGAAEDLRDELDGLRQLLADDSRTAAFFTSPLVDARLRAAALDRAFRGKASDLLADALQVIARKGRLELMPAIAEEYRRLVDRRQGIVDARVTSAVALSAELRERLAAELGKALGKTARLSERVDPELLGGVVVEVEGWKFDSSVSAQLQRLQTNLLERAANEIVRGREA
jgi:F-type H+-transporting ATPase subunit delta